jgi:hypothetical protein
LERRPFTGRLAYYLGDASAAVMRGDVDVAPMRKMLDAP